MKKKEESLYDLCWIYQFVSDAIEWLRKKEKRENYFCYMPLSFYGMSAELKEKILNQGEEELEKIEQRIRTEIIYRDEKRKQNNLKRRAMRDES